MSAPLQQHRPLRALASGSIVTFVTVVLALVGIEVALLASVPDQGRSTAWMLTTALMTWAAVRLAVVCASGRAHLFDFFFWLFVYLFMGLAPTVQIRVDEISQTTPGVDPSLDVPTGWVVLLGVAAYEVGRATSWSRHETEPPTAGPTRQTVSVNLPRTLVLLAVAFALAAYYIARVGPGTLFGSRDGVNDVTNQIWPDPAIRAIFSALSTYPLLIATGALVQLRRTLPAAQRPAAAVGIAVGITLLALVANPVSSPRYTFGTVAFALLVYLGAANTAVRLRLLLAGTLFGFLFLFPLADAFRRSDEAVSFQRSGFFSEYAGNPDYDGFWQVGNALSYWLDGLVEPGRQLIGSLLFWVPRSVWGDKPLDTGTVLAQYRGYAVENLSAPLWAEGLANAGLIGVAIALGLLGAVAGRVDHRLAAGLSRGGLWGVVGAVFPVYLVILLRGSLLQATGALIVAVGCVLFVRSNSRPGGAVDVH